jgi:hypothetical protein
MASLPRRSALSFLPSLCQPSSDPVLRHTPVLCTVAGYMEHPGLRIGCPGLLTPLLGTYFPRACLFMFLLLAYVVYRIAVDSPTDLC